MRARDYLAVAVACFLLAAAITGVPGMASVFRYYNPSPLEVVVVIGTWTVVVVAAVLLLVYAGRDREP